MSECWNHFRLFVLCLCPRAPHHMSVRPSDPPDQPFPIKTTFVDRPSIDSGYCDCCQLSLLSDKSSQKSVSDVDRYTVYVQSRNSWRSFLPVILSQTTMEGHMSNDG